MMTDASYIMRVASGYGVAKALLTAVGFGLHTHLATRAMTAKDISTLLSLAPRPTRDWLDILVSVDLLAREGDGDGARYTNTALTAQYLDRNQPGSVCGILELWQMRNYRMWDNLADGLRTGTAQNETKDAGTPFFETLYEEPARLEAFMNAMNGSSVNAFMALAAQFDFGPYRTLLDIGGADALLSRCVAKAHPHLNITSYDLPVVTAIAARKIADAGLSDQIAAVTGDYMRGPLPRADVITMGMILHDNSLETKRALVAKVYEALPTGGAFIAIETFIDDARREATYGLFMSLTMLLEFGDAFDYTPAELERWCRDAGFARFETLPLSGFTSACVAHKA